MVVVMTGIPMTNIAPCCGVQVRLQRPTVTAEMSLMLAIAKFFIAGFSLGSTTPTAFHTSDLLLKGMLPVCSCRTSLQPLTRTAYIAAWRQTSATRLLHLRLPSAQLL